MEPKKVLVVDDEVHIVHVVAIKLRNNGYDVVSAENGAEAYELACEINPDVIVTDYQMPVMTGAEMVAKLRENQKTSDIPVIMLTARGFALDEEKKRGLKISEFLSKPFSPRELLAAIQDVIEQHATVQKN